MIEVKNLVKTFEGREVLKNISMVFEPGKTNLIIGRSGSGKTVLLKNLVGLIRPTSGEILYDGRDLTKLSTNQMKLLRQEMGMIFQGSALFDAMTVYENVSFPLEMFSTLSKSEQRKRAQFCLNRVNLSDAGHLYPSEISGGMMKRAAIARAIALNPKYLFCDEPNSGLDPQTSLVIDNLIYEITREYKMTTIINTHDMNSVMNIGDKIFFIKEGHLEWQGTNKEILTSTNKALNDFVFASDLFKKVKAVEMKTMNLESEYSLSNNIKNPVPEIGISIQDMEIPESETLDSENNTKREFSEITTESGTESIKPESLPEKENNFEETESDNDNSSQNKDIIPYSNESDKEKDPEAETVISTEISDNHYEVDPDIATDKQTISEPEKLLVETNEDLKEATSPTPIKDIKTPVRKFRESADNEDKSKRINELFKETIKSKKHNGNNYI